MSKKHIIKEKRHLPKIQGKENKMKKIKIKICICLLLMFSVFINGCVKNEPPEPIPFSSDEWINGEWKERYRMLEDLENNYELIGMSREEIDEMLGEYSIRCDAFVSDYGEVDYHLGFDVREDYWEGAEVILIGFKDEIVVKYEYEYLSWL